MAFRSPPGLSKRRTGQPLSLNPAAILSAVGSDFRSRQTLTKAKPSFRQAAIGRLEKCRAFHVGGNILTGKSIDNQDIIVSPRSSHERQSITYMTWNIP